MGDEKIKTAATKVPLDMVPLHALKGAARVFQHGAYKYAAGNFLKATIEDGAVARYTGALLRHLADMQDADGRWLDNFDSLDMESGLPEIDHMIAGLLMTRAIMTQAGKLPADPGISRMILHDAAVTNAAAKEPPAFVGTAEELFVLLDNPQAYDRAAEACVSLGIDPIRELGKPPVNHGKCDHKNPYVCCCDSLDVMRDTHND